MRMSNSAVVTRNITWSGLAHSEPYEAGWAGEAVIFVRALKPGIGGAGIAHVEMSADGMNWAREGTSFPLPTGENEVTFGRVSHFGNWLRIAAEFPEGASLVVLVTLHFKS
ncbi:MAG: hypothetical protein ACO1OK_00840 [Devosia sp.]